MPICKDCGKQIVLIQNLVNRRLIKCDPERLPFRQVQSSSDTYDSYCLDDGRLVRGRKARPGEKVTYGYIPHKYTCTGKDVRYRNK